MTVTKQEQTRRSAMLSMAEASRRLSDAIATTGVGADLLADVEADVRRAVAVLQSVQADDPFSGLRDGIDLWDLSRSLPFSPVIGAYSPVRPEVELWVEDGRVRGRATLRRKHVGPPGMAHGGIGALIADQLIAVVPWAMGDDPLVVTRALAVRYRRAIPLDEPLVLEGWGERADGHIAAHGTICADGTACVEADAEMVSASRLRQRGST